MFSYHSPPVKLAFDNIYMYNANGDNTAVVTQSDLPINIIIGRIQSPTRFPVCLADEPNINRVIEVHITSNGSLVERSGSTSWTNWVSAARDCLEQNVELGPSDASDPRGHMLRTIRPVKSGQRLFVWFSDTFSLRTGVPILLPENILGFRQYRCSFCLKEFLFPNVLKSHLLTRSCQMNTTPFHPVPSYNPPFLCAPVPSLPTSLDTIWCLEILSRLAGASLPSTSRSANSKIQLTTLSPDLSDQHPATVSTITSNVNAATSSDSKLDSCELSLLPGTTEPLDLIPRSLYTSKDHKGHLCIYCGKLYSRKYGLKIHLRTHTGYKPLKCKICLRPFGDPSNLNKHVRLHAEGETPYRCEFCSKVLVRRRDLERHIRSRHSDQRSLINIFVGDDSVGSTSEENDVVVVDEEIEEGHTMENFLPGARNTVL